MEPSVKGANIPAEIVSDSSGSSKPIHPTTPSSARVALPIR